MENFDFLVLGKGPREGGLANKTRNLHAQSQAFLRPENDVIVVVVPQSCLWATPAIVCALRFCGIISIIIIIKCQTNLMDTHRVERHANIRLKCLPASLAVWAKNPKAFVTACVMIIAKDESRIAKAMAVAMATAKAESQKGNMMAIIIQPMTAHPPESTAICWLPVLSMAMRILAAAACPYGPARW